MSMKINNYDSNEELYFSWYCEELKEHKLIIDYSYHEIQYVLSDRITMPSFIKHKGKERYKDRFLSHDHIYTPDFILYWTEKGLDYLTEKSRYFKYYTNGYFELSMRNRDIVSIIDVKGIFAGKNNSTAVTFPLNQKWVFQKYGDYVQKIIPIKLFEETFFPKRYMYNDEGKKPRRRKVGIEYRDIKDMRLPMIDDFIQKRTALLQNNN